MRGETNTILEDFKQAKLFHSVGQPVNDENVIVVKNWKEAVKWAKTIKWQNLKLEWRNELTSELCAKHRGRFEAWNDIAQELREQSMPMVAEKVDAIDLEESVAKNLRDSVNWDILSLLQESEYSDLITPRYYAALGLIYFDGHFPCGWDGEYPEGNLVVF